MSILTAPEAIPDTRHLCYRCGEDCRMRCCTPTTMICCDGLQLIERPAYEMPDHGFGVREVGADAELEPQDNPNNPFKPIFAPIIHSMASSDNSSFSFPSLV